MGIWRSLRSARGGNENRGGTRGPRAPRTEAVASRRCNMCKAGGPKKMGGERACTLACPGVINQCLAEMATDLRMITRISTAKGMAEPKVTIEQGAVAFRGTAGQTALAEWVFSELDQPENWQALVPQSPNPVSHAYRLAVNGDD